MRRAAALAASCLLAVAACSGTEPPADVPSASPSPASAATSVPRPASPEATEQATASAFYDAGSQADTAYAQLLNEGREADAALIKRIADQPAAVWLGEWLTDPAGRVAAVSSKAAAADQIALFVVYAIPGRDCGLHSAGGLPQEQYLDFTRAVASGIDPASETWVVLEPDALAQLGECDGQGDRVALLADAARILDVSGVQVFLDVGHSGWLSVEEASRRIELVGTEHLTGFATNTSNYNATVDEFEWGEQVAALTGLTFITDTSRNGNGSNGEWCNPRGRAIGEAPGLTDRGAMVAAVWTKAPGESDGQCNGGPAAGQWWMEVAIELARNADPDNA